MKRYFKFFFYVLILLAFLLCSSASADVKYRISNYSMNVLVRSDGSASVTEMVIYEFDGPYSSFLHEFFTDDLDGIEDISICIDGQQLTHVQQMTYENDTFTLTEDGPLLKLQIYSPGSGTRLVTCEYKMLGLAKRYEDTGVIYRKFIDEKNSVRLENASLTVRFERQAPLRAFAHGGMDMTHVNIGKDVVHFGPTTVYSGDYVQIRLLFPTALIEDAPLNAGRVLESHLASEELLDAQSRERAARIRTSKYVFVGAYAAIFILFWLWAVRKYHLKGRSKQDADIRRLTSFPAAFAAVTLNEAPDTDTLCGTLIELVQKGLVRMEHTADNIRFIRTEAQTSDLYPHQQKVLDWLFEKDDSLLLSDFHAGANYSLAKSFEDSYALYCEQVTEDMSERGLIYRNDGLRIAVNALVVLLGIAGVGYILLVGTPIITLGTGLLLIMFLCIHLMSRIRTLTNEGELLARDARFFKEKEIRPVDVNAFAAHYAALSMTEQLVLTMENRRLDNRTWSKPDYLDSGWHLHLRQLCMSMLSAHNHNASVPASRNASASDSLGRHDA